MNNNSLQHIVESASKQGHTLEIISTIKSGKEAEVFAAELDGTIVALKVYKDPEHRTFRNAKDYVTGKHYKKPSEKKAVAKGNAFSKKLLHSNWVEREFFMLQKFYALDTCVPQPILLLESALCMEYIGDTTGAAPRLCDVQLPPDKLLAVFEKILSTISTFWKHGIVHGDLSPFNILWHKEQPYIIDFPQAIDIRNHPQAKILLERDIRNMWEYTNKKVALPKTVGDYLSAFT